MWIISYNVYLGVENFCSGLIIISSDVNGSGSLIMSMFNLNLEIYQIILPLTMLLDRKI